MLLALMRAQMESKMKISIQKRALKADGTRTLITSHL